MNAFSALLLFLGLLPGSRATCTTAYGDKIRYCKTFQTDYIEGIEILIFEERDVGRINSTVFSSPNLKSVLSLTLKGSKIHTIEAGAFQQFQGLRNMELQDNSLTTLSPSWFYDPASLRNLTMANNRIGQLRPEMMEGFSNLERLNLSRNQISSVHRESFWGLSKMSSLDLSYNKISSLKLETLSPLNGTSLRLGGNPWNCSCAHKDFILFLKELMNTSRLTDPSLVTCRYPADLMGVLVWNVSEMNCSSPALTPSSEAVFHNVVLPVLFVVLALFLFILLILLLWKKNQHQKQVQPDKKTNSEASARFTRRSPPVSGDLVILNKAAAGQNPPALGRARSAAAVLLQTEFSPKTQSGKRSEESKWINPIRGGHDPMETSEGNVEMWYYDSWQGKVSQTFNVHPITSSNLNDNSATEASTHTPGPSTRSKGTDDLSTRSTTYTEEPLVYLCMNTTQEDFTTNIPTQKVIPCHKPRIMRRTLSWPNVLYKKEPGSSYEDFLKSLNISPRPEGSYTIQEKSKKTPQKVDDVDCQGIQQVYGVRKGLPKKKDPALGSKIKNVTEGQPRPTTRNVYQRTSHGRGAPRSKVVTPDTGGNREGLHSQGSELRRTPDDDQLLEDNEYNFIDLLHEVVENHGRWTRERWRQTHQQRVSSRTSPHCGVFFSMSMGLIVCILTSRCKNKVTNISDSDCPLHQSPDTCAEPHHPFNGGAANHVLEIDPEIRSAMQTDLLGSGRFLQSDLRTSKSEPLVFPIKAPVLNTFTFKTSDDVTACQTVPKVHSATELYKRDPIIPPSPRCTQDVEAHGGRCDYDVYGNQDVTGETGRVTYLETHIDSKDLSKTGKSKTDGNDPSPEPVVSSNPGNLMTLGKKCKTWSTFCTPQICLDPKMESNEFVGKGDLQEEPTKGLEETSCTCHEDHQGQDINHERRGEGASQKDTMCGHNQQASKVEESLCKPQHKGPSRMNKTSKPSKGDSLGHEKFWKYHKNCCDEFEPCQTASNVLRQQTTEETKRAPPPDEELLEERSSFPVLYSEPSENHRMMNPTIFFRLPDLAGHGNHNPNASSTFTSYTGPEVEEDKTSNDNTFPIIDLPPANNACHEGLAEVSPSRINLPIVYMKTEGNLGRRRDSSEDDYGPCKPDLQVLSAEARDLKSQSLPVLNTPRGEQLGEDGIQQVTASREVELPIIDLQTESPSRNKIQQEVPSSVHRLPTINVPSAGHTEGLTISQDDLPVNLEVQISVKDKTSAGEAVVDTPTKHELPPIDVQSETLVIKESNQPDGNKKEKSKSCPVLSAPLDVESQDNKDVVKSEMDTETLPDSRDLRNPMMPRSGATTFEISQEVPPKSVESRNAQRQESQLSNKGQKIHPSGLSDLNLGVQTQLTPSASYSMSLQDGDEISEWPNTADILKQSSTISLSSKYDILENCTAPKSEEDDDDSTTSHHGHNVVSKDLYDHEAEDDNNRKSSSLEESTSTTMEKVLSNGTTEKNTEISYLWMTDSHKPPDTGVKDDPTSEQKNLLQTSNPDEISTIHHGRLVDAEGHQLSMVLNGQREDFHELEDPSHAYPPKVSESVDKCMDNLERIYTTSEGQLVHNTRRDDSLPEPATSNQEVAHFSHQDIDLSEGLTGNKCKILENLPREDGCPRNKHKLIEGPDPRCVEQANQSSLCATSNLRKSTGAPKREANKTIETDDHIQDVGQDLKDYTSTRLSRRPFQSVFPVSVKSPRPEDVETLKASSSEENALNNATEMVKPPRVCSSATSKKTDAVQYLTYLYARSPKLKPSPDPYRDPDVEDTTTDDIRVLSNLHFCKVSGGFLADTESSQTIQEAAQDTKLASSNPKNPYIPPGKEELEADEELAVLHVMYTLRKSLELSNAYYRDVRNHTQSM